jgi:hypothetical protein
MMARAACKVSNQKTVLHINSNTTSAALYGAGGDGRHAICVSVRRSCSIKSAARVRPVGGLIGLKLKGGVRMNMPGFTAEASLERARNSYQAADTPISANYETGVAPASRRAVCRRLLKECVSGDDPRSYACDSWLILC